MRKLLVLLAATLTACSDGGGGPPAVASVTVAASPSTNLTVGQTAQLSATPKDGSGNTLQRPVTYRSVNDAVVSVSPAGIVTANGVGEAMVVATAETKEGRLLFTVTAPPPGSVAVAPTAVEVAAGATTQLTATVRDAGGAVLPAASVTWTSSDESKATVAGNAGTQTATVTGVAGGTVTITASSSGTTGQATVAVTTPASPQIVAIAPGTLTPGATATITGSNFSTTPASNLVTVDGVSATVTGATATSLTVALPAGGFACQATRNASVIVTVASLSGVRAHPLGTAQLRTLAPGQSLRIDDPVQVRCNELAPAAGNARYVIAVYNTTPGGGGAGTAAFQLHGESGLAPSPAIEPLMVSAAPSAARVTGFGGVNPDEARARRRAHESHVRLLEANRAFAAQQLRAGITARPARVAAAPGGAGASFVVNPNVGAVTQVRIPDIGQADFCRRPLEVNARTVYSGTRAIIVEDNANPLAGQFDSYYQAVGQEFDNVMWPILTGVFGNPLAMDDQLDDNDRIVMLFSKRVNDFQAGVAGFVVSCDFFPRNATTNTASNEGEFFYARAPVTSGSGFPQGQGQFTADQWRRAMRSTIIHEVKHITSFGERIARNAPAFEQTWLEEGTAMHAEEIWVRGIYGVAWKGNSNYAATLFCDVRPTSGQCTDRPFVMYDHFIFLYDYLTATEDLSLLGSEAGAAGSTFYGTAWSFVRWAIDQYMPSDESFLKPLTQSTLSGVANVVERTGRPFGEMLGDWALALATDDVAGFTPDREALRFPSWNLRGIYAGINADFPEPQNFPRVFPLEPRPVSFGTFNVNASVRAGTISYFELSGSATSRQLVEVRSQGGGDPSSLLRVAVVRVQ